MSDNHKGILQELCQKRKEVAPVYSKPTIITDISGNFYFTSAVVYFKGQKFTGEGKARSKKDAEKSAAQSVLQSIFAVHPHERMIIDSGSGLENRTGSSNSGSVFSSSSSGSSTSSSLGSFGGDIMMSDYFTSSTAVTVASATTATPTPTPGLSASSSVFFPNGLATGSAPSAFLSGSRRGGQDQSDLTRLQLQLEHSIRTFTERYNMLEKKYNDLRELVDRRHTDTREYIDRKLKRKSRKAERSPVVQTTNLDDLSMCAAPQTIVNTLALADSPTRSVVATVKLDTELIPDQITFFRYRTVFSHGFKSEEFSHLDQQYNFSGFLLYTVNRVPKPVVHISNGAGEHFAMSMLEYERETMTRDEFAQIVTFHSCFYNQILQQKHMNYQTLNEFYFVPHVKCLSNPTQKLHKTLTDLLTYEDLTNEIPSFSSDKEFHAYFDHKYLSKVILTPRPEFCICRAVDHTRNYAYNDPSLLSIRDRAGNPIELKSGVFPSVMCTHTGAVINKEHWKLKTMIYFDSNGHAEDPSKWDTDEFNEMEPTIWESYIRRTKLLAKDPLILKVFGITSTMHAIAKVAILSYIPEVEWAVRIEQFKKQIIPINNPKLLREVFTHPSTNRHNLVPPRALKIFRDYHYFQNDNQRLEYLGDSILKFCVSLYLFFMYPTASEGFLTTKRSEVTSNSYLQDICDQTAIDEILRLSNSKEDIKKPKADVVEALFAAVFVERGINDAYEFISNLLFKVENTVFPTFKCDHQSEIELSESQKSTLFDINMNIKHTCLFAEAMNCSSDPKMNYQRLEFLGDSFIDLVVSEYLYVSFPAEQEGFLSQARALLVRNENLASVSVRLRIRDCIEAGVIPTTKRMGDLFESFTGCMILDKGVQETKEFLIKHIPLNVDHVNELLESFYASNRPIPLSVFEAMPHANQDISIPPKLMEELNEDIPASTPKPTPTPTISPTPTPKVKEIPIEESDDKMIIN